MSENSLGLALLGIAHNAIAASLDLNTRTFSPDPEQEKPGASFVTLTQDGRLRGCIGSLEAYRTLAEDVAANAVAAAFRDTRFAPLTRHEWASTRIEVSQLTPRTNGLCQRRGCNFSSASWTRWRDLDTRDAARDLPAAGMGIAA